MAARKKISLIFGWIVYTTDIDILSYLNKYYTKFDDGHISYVEYNNIPNFKDEFFREMKHLESLQAFPYSFSISEILIAVDGDGKILATRHFEF